MAAFEPQTTLYLFQDTCIDVHNEPYFNSKAEQWAWFSSRIYATFPANSYQREERYVSIDMPPELVRKADYLCFLNAGNGDDNGRVYGMITSVEFINPHRTDVYYVIDSFQSFITEVTFLQSFVEREMVTNDWNGSFPNFQSLLDEGLGCGPQTVVHTDKWRTEGFRIVVLSAYDEQAEPVSNINFNFGVPTTLNTFSFDDASQLNPLLQAYAEKGRLDGIAAIFYVPMEYANRNYSTTKTVELPTSFEGYEPKNSKVFSSEFCVWEISNLQGESVYLKPELCQTPGSIVFNIYGTFSSGNGGLTIFPEFYAGQPVAYDEAVHLLNNVQCAWSGDAYKNWIANTRASRVSKLMGTALNAGINTVAANVLSDNDTKAALGAVRAIQPLFDAARNAYAEHLDQRVDRYKIQSLESGNSIMAGINEWGFDIRFWGPKRAMLESIDNFFTKYGYKVCRLKVPNIDTRPFWNFVKTSGCQLKGKAPQKHLDNIRAQFDNGVTLWHVTKGAVIGNYDFDNRG